MRNHVVVSLASVVVACSGNFYDANVETMHTTHPTHQPVVVHEDPEPIYSHAEETRLTSAQIKEQNDVYQEALLERLHALEKKYKDVRITASGNFPDGTGWKLSQVVGGWAIFRGERQVVDLGVKLSTLRFREEDLTEGEDLCTYADFVGYVGSKRMITVVGVARKVVLYDAAYIESSPSASR